MTTAATQTSHLTRQRNERAAAKRRKVIAALERREEREKNKRAEPAEQSANGS